ncbi:MAG TPA: RtcB family protein [Planctomycetota bacterium]|nr:RtcB family protein [Planctomycetota bacterium]
MADVSLRQISDHLFEIPPTGDMRVPGRIYASRALMELSRNDESLQQVAHVAELPGIVGASLAMPDFHWGYGFPIGGVAAFDAESGVVSPGGVGYDINCGVRLVRTGLKHADVKDRIRDVARQIFRDIPAGVGSDGTIKVKDRAEGARLVTEGARWAVERGFGSADDLLHIEEGGRLEGADPEAVPHRAWERGLPQVGSLGSGNHFLEIQIVDEIFHPAAAARFGLERGTVAFAIHSGSRGFGHQICEESLASMVRAAGKYGIRLPDRQLCCAPLGSPEASRYLGAMFAAANFAFANRQVMKGVAEKALARATGRSADDLDARLVYDVCHNIAKFETHEVGGKPRKLCVHRKGATRALPPGHALIPEAYRDLGQPVLVPGDMGRASYLLIGNARASKDTFASTCHGAGRRHSRTAMKRMLQGRDLQREMLEKHGVVVMAHSRDGIIEEMPEAYKDVSEVVEVMERAGISDRVVRLKPIACIKG